ncbi:rCG47725 [Rattus norvegicus]|uniref:RCG47725 n=1 Tax=Rattus norvegicus TaxID=10116 RepID=A6I151_RAT|nr:rCG47725 [Rattus norvegicus]
MDKPLIRGGKLFRVFKTDRPGGEIGFLCFLRPLSVCREVFFFFSFLFFSFPFFSFFTPINKSLTC